MQLRWSSASMLLAWGWPLVAQGYVRTLTSAGVPMYWNRTILDIVAYAGDPPPALTESDTLAAVRAAAATWSRGQLSCTSLELRVSSTRDTSAPVGLDGTNRLTFRRDSWCREPRADGEPCYDPLALAVTTVFAGRGEGVILDADVELNGQFIWGDLVRQPTPGQGEQDLQNTQTHELGHFIGLDHTCSLSADRADRVDDQDHPVPICANASETVKATTMFPGVIPGDTERSSLSPDDMRAVRGLPETRAAGGQFGRLPDGRPRIGRSGRLAAGGPQRRSPWPPKSTAIASHALQY
jgi:hypothetical protein